MLSKYGASIVNHRVSCSSTILDEMASLLLRQEALKMVQLFGRSDPIIFQLCLRYYVGRRSCFFLCVCEGGGV